MGEIVDDKVTSLLAKIMIKDNKKLINIYYNFK